MPHDHSTLQLLRTRRSASLKTLAPPGPSEQDLATILAIGARVPDHAKLVPWRFIVIQGVGRERLGAAIEAAYLAANPGAEAGAAGEARAKLGGAPLTIAVVSSPKVHPKVPEWEQILSAGAVCMNMLIAARALGYGAVWYTEWYAYDRGVLNELGLSAQERIAGFVHIGTDPSPREDRPRPDLGTIVARLGE